MLILLSDLYADYADEYWIKVQSPTTRDLSKCFFINNNTGWVSGDSGTIIKTTNGGNNWVIQNTNIFNDIKSIFFISKTFGWAIAYEVFPDSTSYLGTRMLKTTDGGDNWSTFMYPDTNQFMRSIYFLDSLNGFMTGINALIVRSTDAGRSWVKTDTDTTLKLGLPIENILFYNHQIGYACGGFRDLAGAMWTTTNGGYNWKAQICAPEPFNDIYIFNQNNAMSVGGDFEYGSSYVKTTNLGFSWNYDTLGTFGVSTSIDFRTPAEGWITIAIAQKFSYTLDSGNTWQTIYTPDSSRMYDVQFTDSTHGWAVGSFGTIFQYSNLVNIHNNAYSLNKSFKLFQNYPNPFNPSTDIKFEISESGFISLKVFNNLGQEVSLLVNEKKYPGNYSVNFDGENFPSGVYFYQLAFNGYVIAAKSMLLIK